jgi:hypothetical protein
MHDSTRALLKRGSVVAATAAMVLGSSFAAVPAMAASSDTAEPTPTETSASTGADAAPDPSQAPLPSGLKEAVERDLGTTIEEFYKNGELSAVVDSMAKALKKSGLEADFAIAENQINVTVAASSLQAVTKKLAELTTGTDVELGIEAAPVTAAPSVSASDRAPESSDSGPDASEPQISESPTGEAAPAPPAPRVEAKGLPQSVDTLLAEYLNSVEPSAASGLQSVMKNMDGGFVIRTGGAAQVEKREAASVGSGEILQPTKNQGQKLTPEEFAGQYTKVTIEAADGPASPAAANDVLGGMAYGALVGEVGSQRLAMCSVGFSGFNPKGAPASISAGHCSQDGDVSKVKIIEQAGPDIPIALGADLGTFGFSQFGGPGNSPVSGWYEAETIDDLGNVGTDISVIDKINKSLDLEALVTDWKGVDERDSGTKVTGVASAVLGTNICKSGRTTGWTCGTVDEVGVFVVGGSKGEDDIRAVRGFAIANPFIMAPDPFNPGAQIEVFEKADRGDSGGSVLAGGNAVGITSAVSTSEGGRAYFTDVKDALKHAKGYTIELSLKAPTVTSPSKGADVAAGATISGTAPGAPSGSSVVVRSGGKKIATVKVASGKFSFRAPAVLGTFDFTLQTVNGYSTSVATAGSVNILVGTPVIKTPANGKTFTEAQSVVSGTGVPGATIKLTGALSRDVIVGSNGRWSVELDDGLSYGPHRITAVQTLREVTSSSVKSGFKVVPVAPSIDSLTPGQEFASGKAPKTLSGFGINGSTIRVSIGDTRLTAVVTNGAWTVLVPERLRAGDHKVSAVQVIDDVASAATSITFRIAGVPRQPPTQAPEPSTAPVVPQGNPKDDDSDNGSLVSTGPNGALPFIASSGALMVAGGLFMLLRRKGAKIPHHAVAR